MKAKINIEIFDNSSLKECEAIGFYAKTLETLYKDSFESILKEVCVQGSDYTLSVEIEDNTTK